MKLQSAWDSAWETEMTVCRRCRRPTNATMMSQYVLEFEDNSYMYKCDGGKAPTTVFVSMAKW